MSLLLDRGADIKATDRIGVNPLTIAISNGHKDVVSLLLDGGADADDIDYDGDTALITAATRHGHSDVVSLLLDRVALTG